MMTRGTGKARPLRGTAGSLLLVLALGALAVCGFETATGGWHATPVLSGSMRPGVQPGDVVVTQRVPVSDLHVRDVIVFHPPDEGQRQTVHRIVKLAVKHGKTEITTRGDANTIDDPAVTTLRGATAYRVVRVVPLVGYPAVWLSGGHHGLFAIGLGALLLVAAAVIILRPEAPRQRPRHQEHDPGDLAPPRPEAADGVSTAEPLPAGTGAPRHLAHADGRHEGVR